MAKGAWYLGLDVGSAASKCVIIDDKKQIAAKAVHASGAGTAGPKVVLEACLEEAGISLEDITASCTTGDGRHLFDWATYSISELSCHAKGAAHLFPGIRTVIDIGGQDAKALAIDSDGSLESFVMNDKCAAGTGRFLEVMASIFGCKVSELSSYDDQSTEIASISSTCTVFAESEVISKLASGTPIPNVVAGVHSSVVDRALGLVRRLGIKAPICMTGGVALNESLRRRFEKSIGSPIATSELSQFNGAFGAALLTAENDADGRR